MKQAARELEFEKAALLRDQIVDLRRVMQSEDPVVPREWLKTR
jgi:excinuclease UvrABC nuclease subunit